MSLITQPTPKEADAQVDHDPVLAARNRGNRDTSNQGVDTPPPSDDNEDAGQDDDEGVDEYIAIYYLGILPAGTVDMAQTMAARYTTAQLYRTAEELYALLQEEFCDLRGLNGDNRPFAALMAIPGTHQVRVLYGLGGGSAGIGHHSPLQGNILCLAGDGGKTMGPQRNGPSPRNEEENISLIRWTAMRS